MFLIGDDCMRAFIFFIFIIAFFVWLYCIRTFSRPLWDKIIDYIAPWSNVDNSKERRVK